MDAYLREKVVELITYHKLNGECNNIHDEDKIFIAFASGAVAAGVKINDVAPAYILQSYIDKISPFGFKYGDD